ncbi:hypothetical protein JNE44_01940 [Kocuria rhizophila]|nr:hypothetical protein [Kocuria rhizophila]
MTAMPRRPAPSAAAPLRRRSAAVVAVALLLATTVLTALTACAPDPVPTTDCTHYGLAADDPRARPHTVTRATQETDGDQTQAGALGRLDQSFTHGDTTSSFHVVDGGVDPSRPVGLVVDLHGDGGAEFYEPGGRTTCLAAVAASHNALLAVPLTPDGAEDRTWWQEIGPNLRWLRALTEEKLLTDLPVARDRVTWMGYSGGAEMMTYGVLSGARDLVTGGAVMIGGGGAPDALVQPATARQKKDLPLWWATGSNDVGTDPNADFDALRAAREGQGFYEERGFRRTRLHVVQGRDHFDMPDAAILDELLGAEEPSPTATR